MILQILTHHHSPQPHKPKSQNSTIKEFCAHNATIRAHRAQNSHLKNRTKSKKIDTKSRKIKQNRRKSDQIDTNRPLLKIKKQIQKPNSNIQESQAPQP